MRLMIVDDSLVIRNKISRALANEFSNIILASNGQEAISKAKIDKPDIVTMDLTMPEMDGIASIEALQNILSAAKILVVSAIADKATAIEALTKGANGFLCKPFSAQELDDAIRKIIKLEY